jgi:hypothetical protein
MKIIKISLIFLLFIIASFSVLGVSYGSWNQYQRWNFNGGFENNLYSLWNGTSIYSETGIGNSYQPIVYDWDSDNITEYITSMNNILYIYTISSSGSLILENSFNMGATQNSNGQIVDSSDNYLIIGFGTTIYSLLYNGSSLNKSINNTLNSATMSGIKCASATNTCYWFSGSNLSVANPFDLSTMTQTTNFTGKTFITDPPVLMDSDADGVYEIITGMITNTASHQLAVIDSSTLSLDTTFSTDGLVTLSGASGVLTYAVNHVIGYDLVNGFGLEICVLFQGENADAQLDAWLNCYDFAGNLLLHNMIVDDNAPGVPAMGNLFLADIDGVDSLDVCAYSFEETSSYPVIKCFNGFDGSFDQVGSTLTISNTNNFSTSAILTSADMNNDGLYDIIGGNNILFSNGSIFTSLLISSSASLSSNSVPVDINDDGLLEVCGSSTSETFCASSIVINSPPTLYTNLSHSGYIGYYSNPCLNTAVTFYAEQNDVNTNYYNDIVSDTERLVSNCGQNVDGSKSSSYTTNLLNGTYDLSSPSFSCVYNQSGLFNVRLYLQDNRNTGDYSQYNTDPITLNVIDGISGVSCDTIIVLVPEEVTPPTTTNGSTFGEDITGGSLTYKTILALILVIALIIVASKYTSNALAVCAVGILGVILSGIIGWMSLSVVILILVSLTVLLVLFLTIFKPSPGG